MQVRWAPFKWAPHENGEAGGHHEHGKLFDFTRLATTKAPLKPYQIQRSQMKEPNYVCLYCLHITRITIMHWKAENKGMEVVASISLRKKPAI